ncbi:hypothetical protein PHISCL_07538 [Aspergillus sclerotialis]|uniref:DUF7707 domain-containing protein n=1 Tax=Aspergillus sclerotialis TaxID=2070753 RepID=A0A3A2ZAJ3_9EURO|nr:hypothetical protein PHISCL_07538 [Aspergillus sclerotialis]
MWSSRALVSAALVATVAANYTLPSGFDINQVDLSERGSWCTAERNTCPKICGGIASSNSCDPQSLSFSCVCDNGTTANVEPYMQTVPYFVCQKTYGQCITRHPDDLEGQEKCKASAKSCGTLNATETSSSSSSSATGSSTASATLATTTQAGDSSATASSTGSATTTTNAAALMVQEHSTSLFAAGLFFALRYVL